MALVFLSSLMTWTEGDTRCVVDADMDELPADAEMAVDHARLKAPHQPSRPHWEQPIEAPQLVMEPNSVRISHAQTTPPTRIKAGKPIICFNTSGMCESKDFIEAADGGEIPTVWY